MSSAPLSGGRSGRDAPSQVGTIGAMRARDVSRPHVEELAAAERDVSVAFRPANERPKRPLLEDPRQSSGRGGSTPEAS